MNTVVKLGFVFVALGAVAMAGPVFGFTTIAADRGVSAETASDANALVGIETTGETPDKKNDAVIVEITNNANQAYDPLETDVTIDDPNGALAVSSGFATALSSGDTTGLEVTCDGGGDGTATVTVNANAVGSTLEVREDSYTTAVDYSCTGKGSNANFEVRNPGLGADTDELEFGLENVGSDRAKIHGISVDETTAEAIEVENDGNGNPPPVEFGGAETKAGVVRIGDGEYDLQGNEKVGAGETVAVGIYGFQTGAGDPVSVEGEDVTISLYGSKGRLDKVTVSVPVFPSGGEDVTTDGDVILEAEETSGGIDAGGDLIAEDSSKIDGAVDVDGEVDLGGSVESVDTIDAGGDVTTGLESSVKNDVTSRDGSVTTGEKSTIKGTVDAGENATVGAKGEVDGDVIAGGDVVLREDAVVKGDVTADGCVTLEAGAQVKGEISENCG
ncbi:bactofilin family protein [Natrinema salsiterrestre]|uniref:Polymer-forming cytoskeletal protein n=1 Tax=Natrinema salsiterrestre TaxID=2950540 RepID=A0A9Q4L147_9EURY|nr:polymer-forming cytoskeletal protein [Natrinema salsiterrestre]MDF9744928.1 polymer-forming cytoskeletal protein [Natrinema salsiterrestre]